MFVGINIVVQRIALVDMEALIFHNLICQIKPSITLNKLVLEQFECLFRVLLNFSSLF